MVKRLQNSLTKKELRDLVLKLNNSSYFYNSVYMLNPKSDKIINDGWLVFASYLASQHDLKKRKKFLMTFIDSLPCNLPESLTDKNNFLKRLLLLLIPNFRDKLENIFSGTSKWHYCFYSNLQSFLEYLYGILEDYIESDGLEEIKKESSLRKHINILKLEALEHFYDEYEEPDFSQEYDEEESLTDLNISKYFVSVLKIADYSLRPKLTSQDYFSLVGEISNFMDTEDIMDNLLYLNDSFINSIIDNPSCSIDNSFKDTLKPFYNESLSSNDIDFLNRCLKQNT